MKTQTPEPPLAAHNINWDGEGVTRQLDKLDTHVDALNEALADLLSCLEPLMYHRAWPGDAAPEEEPHEESCTIAKRTHATSHRIAFAASTVRTLASELHI